jgi:polyisoprenoid-binding protein YceI
MKKVTLSIACSIAIFGSIQLKAQDLYFTKTAKVEFNSKTPIENIEAENNEATSFLNKATGDIVFAVLVKSFRFEKALMEEHFNENYMESNKYPKSDFKGKITNLSDVNFAKDGNYKVKVAGVLTMHGISKPANADGTITISGGKISASSTFKVKLADYKIERPAVVADKISETIDIKVQSNYEPKK